MRAYTQRATSVSIEFDYLLEKNKTYKFYGFVVTGAPPARITLRIGSKKLDEFHLLQNRLEYILDTPVIFDDSSKRRFLSIKFTEVNKHGCLNDLKVLLEEL